MRQRDTDCWSSPFSFNHFASGKNKTLDDLMITFFGAATDARICRLLQSVVWISFCLTLFFLFFQTRKRSLLLHVHDCCTKLAHPVVFL
jgi:hypothetical protein